MSGAAAWATLFLLGTYTASTPEWAGYSRLRLGMQEQHRVKLAPAVEFTA